VLSRRGFLLGTGAAALLAACGGDDDGVSAGTNGATTTVGAGGSLVLGEAFDRNGLLVAGIGQRAPFVLFETTGGLVTVADAPAEIAFTLTPEGGDALAPIVVPRHGDDVDRPYYPLRATFPSAGVWTVTADLGDGGTLETSIGVNEQVPVAQVGEPLPVAPTPTVADPLGVATICTQDPACPFHTTSLDAAVASGGPIAVLLSTPAYCQVGICGPVLDLLVEAAGEREGLTVVHVEVYPNPSGNDPGDPSPVVQDTFSLSYEPALFVASGPTVTARLDNIYDGAELADALATAGP
jgi:hypothetical protein